jgi:hypothetical protein
MRSAARNDESTEQQKYPAKGQIVSLADKVEQCDGNGVIGDRNHCIGNDV